MDLTQSETHSTSWNSICSTTNSTSNDTNIMCYLLNQREIIHIVFYVVSGIAFFVSTSILFVYWKCHETYKLTKAKENCILFFCFIVTIVAELSHDKGKERVGFNIYTTVILFCFGIITFVRGSNAFFDETIHSSTDCSIKEFFDKLFSISTDKNTLGYHHEGIGIIVCLIAIPLVGIEIVIFVTIFRQKIPPDTKAAYAVVVLISSLQIAIQAVLYNYRLRNRKFPAEKKKRGASLFFKIASLFNFTMWLESIASEYQSKEHFEQLFNTKNLAILAALYSALIIDYRLLCSLLFLEHALEVEEHNDSEQTHEDVPLDRPNTAIFTFMGCVFGLVIMGFSTTNSLQYFTKIPPWFNIFPYLIQIIVVCIGYCLLKQIPNETGDKTHRGESSSAGVDIMVTLMGVYSMAFWLLKGSIIIIWCIKVPREILDNQLIQFRMDESYLIWQGIKFLARAVCIVFQIIFFRKINSSFGRSEEIVKNRWNHFYLLVIIFGLLSIFGNSLFDSYSGFVEDNVRKSGFGTVVLILYDSGMPIHLGFCIHLFLHFLIIYKRMRKTVKSDQKKLLTREVNNYTSC